MADNQRSSAQQVQDFAARQANVPFTRPNSSRIGQNHPGNPFSAAGRSAGKTEQELRDLGLDANGHPAASRPRNGHASGPARPGGVRGQNIGKLAQSIGELELSNQEDLYAFCEAVRGIQNYLAVSIKLAEGQLKARARQQARQAKDGWMTPAQAVKLATTLKMVGRDLSKSADGCVSAATGAVKAWRRFETLLDELENSGSSGGFRRPGSSRRGGFNVV